MSSDPRGPGRFTARDRAAEAGDRHQRSRARQDADDANPGAAPGSTRLWQERTADMGRRMPDSVGAAQCRETRHGEVDDRQRLRRAPGRGWAADAGGAQGQPHSDDGAARVLRCGRECRVERGLPDHLRAVRSARSGGARVAPGSRRESERHRRPAKPGDPWHRQWARHGTGLRDRDLRAFTRATERLHRPAPRRRGHDPVRRSGRIGSAPSPARSPGRATGCGFSAGAPAVS